MTLIEEVRSHRALPAPAVARAVREAAGVSRSRLARELGVHRMTVTRWENGQRTPSGPTGAAYARLLRDLQQLGLP